MRIAPLFGIRQRAAEYCPLLAGAPVPVGLEKAMSKIVHFEFPVDDAARAAAFYRDALGWEISGFGDQPYWLVRAGTDDEPGANGALLARGELHRSPVLIVGVSDLDAALAKVESSGGRVLQGKLAVPGVGWAAYFADPENNTIGLFEPDANAVGNA